MARARRLGPGRCAHDRTHASTDAQRLLPAAVGGSTPFFTTQFTPTSTQFGFKVTSFLTGEWSDPTLNATTVDVQNGCTTSCGHHVRFWPAEDRAGTPIPGAYLMTMDYGSSEAVNYDFQDNVYLLENVVPAPGL